MVESISELEKKCLPNREVRGRAGEHWITAKFQRKISIRLTWLLLHFPLSANHVSMLSFFLGLLAAFVVTNPGYYHGIIAVFLLLFSEVLDSCDGEIARYKKSASKKGEMIEGIFSPGIIHGFFLLGIAFRIFQTQPNPIFFALAGIAAILIAKFEHVKELSREYQTKEFHSSPSDTVKKTFTSIPSLLIFLGESKFFRYFIFLIAAVAGAFNILILTYPLAVIISFLLYSARFLSKADQQTA